MSSHSKHIASDIRRYNISYIPSYVQRKYVQCNNNNDKKKKMMTTTTTTTKTTTTQNSWQKYLFIQHFLVWLHDILFSVEFGAACFCLHTDHSLYLSQSTIPPSLSRNRCFPKFQIHRNWIAMAMCAVQQRCIRTANAILWKLIDQLELKSV